MSAALAAEVDQSSRPALEARRIARVEEFLATMLRLMGYGVRPEVTDLGEGNVGVALHCSGASPGLADGKRGHLVESLQLLANKYANHGERERVWVTLGVSSVPEPRKRSSAGAGTSAATASPGTHGGRDAKEVQALGARAASAGHAEGPQGRGGATTRSNGEQAVAKPQAGQPRPSTHSRPRGERSDHVVEPSEAIDLSGITPWALPLAHKAVRLGRPFAVLGLDPEDRLRVLRAASGVPGLAVREEGELHLKRVAFVPQKLAPVPRRAAMPDWDDDDDEE